MNEGTSGRHTARHAQADRPHDYSVTCPAYLHSGTLKGRRQNHKWMTFEDAVFAVLNIRVVAAQWISRCEWIPGVTRCNQMWPCVTRWDQVYQVWPSVTRYDQVWPGVTRCWLEWQGSWKKDEGSQKQTNISPEVLIKGQIGCVALDTHGGKKKGSEKEENDQDIVYDYYLICVFKKITNSCPTIKTSVKTSFCI